MPKCYMFSACYYILNFQNAEVLHVLSIHGSLKMSNKYNNVINYCNYLGVDIKSLCYFMQI